MKEIRVRLKLPDNHPLLQLPQKNRSEIVRSMIDLGIALSDIKAKFGIILADVRNEITAVKETVEAMDKRLAALEINIATREITSSPGEGNIKENNRIDINKFLSAFD